MFVNEKINQEIIDRGYRQEFIAKKMGMTPDTLSRIILKKRKVTAEELINFCRVTGVDINEFYQQKGA